jgi:hypothetical protein
MEKQKDSAYASGSSIVENLTRLASKRSDIFTEEADADDQPKAKKAKTSDTIIWDGSTGRRLLFPLFRFFEFC